ncbi:hypothetical protein PHJA_000205800 [Phtheirospermum japonicum]|uniref:Uncharacterized protein n=1 Tax=Phtheirospermum japonicum TaxID=374723 RepID=A0A830B971_9LAMI|nr:hypothetical protein PHJA_000205800 [Phtheirospermum japonicum]
MFSNPPSAFCLQTRNLLVMASNEIHGNQKDAPESSQNSSEEETDSGLGKAIARRAVYGSSHRKRRGTRLRNSDAKKLPSRLSKVSIADKLEN